MTTFHTPALPSEVLRYLDPKPGKVFIDGTAGGGGHSAEILPLLVPGGLLVALDIDNEAVQFCTERFRDAREQALVIRENYTNIPKVLRSLKLDGADGILVDLGVSSHQVDSAQRGFSFQREGPLDMRMSQALRTQAEDIVNSWSRADLERIFRDYGEERFAGRIARALVEGRPIRSTTALAELVSRVVPHRQKGLHPATRIFQALRIAVNDELESLRLFLERAPEALRPGGTVCVIAYHSLEDRLVKNAFRRREGFEVLTKKPVRPGPSEIETNPRARSARLRALRRKLELLVAK